MQARARVSILAARAWVGRTQRRGGERQQRPAQRAMCRTAGPAAHCMLQHGFTYVCMLFMTCCAMLCMYYEYTYYVLTYVRTYVRTHVCMYVYLGSAPSAWILLGWLEAATAWAGRTPSLGEDTRSLSAPDSTQYMTRGRYTPAAVDAARQLPGGVGLGSQISADADAPL